MRLLRSEARRHKRATARRMGARSGGHRRPGSPEPRLRGLCPPRRGRGPAAAAPHCHPPRRARLGTRAGSASLTCGEAVSSAAPGAARPESRAELLSSAVARSGLPCLAAGVLWVKRGWRVSFPGLRTGFRMPDCRQDGVDRFL